MSRERVHNLLTSALVVAAFLAAAAARASDSDRPTEPGASAIGSDATAVASASADATTIVPGDAVRLAVIGDFGTGGAGAEGVAELVHSWSPDHVLTVGDNNYPNGGADTIDANIGQRYARYIHPYVGEFGPGAASNRFWPALGNHDWGWGHVDAHEDYFELPGNERYYDVVLGPVHVFVLDTHDREPDGYVWGSAQSRWFEQRIAASTAPFQVVTMHYPAFSSGHHGSREEVRWPFADLGVDLVLAGHDHDYERLAIDGIPYVVVGMGGARLRDAGRRHPASRAFVTGIWGAVRIDATADTLTLVAQAMDGTRLDEVVLHHDRRHTADDPWLVAPGSRWHFSGALDDVRRPWSELARDASQGYAPLGHGSYLVETRHDDRDGAARWYAHAFRVDDPALVGPLELRLRSDDGAVVFLNGHELVRDNVIEGPGGLLVADDTVGYVSAQPDVYAVDPALLVAGDNQLTAAVLQTEGGRGDAFFDAELARLGVEP